MAMPAVQELVYVRTKGPSMIVSETSLVGREALPSGKPYRGSKTIIERLVESPLPSLNRIRQDRRDAAETIERLTRELERLRANPTDHRYWEGRYRDAQAENERLTRDCAELYQVIGTLASAHVDLFDHPEVVKALDNASAAADGEPRPHDDLLPFGPISPDDPLLTAEAQRDGAYEECALIGAVTCDAHNQPALGTKVSEAIRAARQKPDQETAPLTKPKSTQNI